MIYHGEEWKPIPGFEGRYEISNYGRARSFIKPGSRGRGFLMREQPRLLSPVKTCHGYGRICLRTGNTRRLIFVHQMVLELFVGPRPEGMQAAHLDGNPANNDVTNLVWATPKENTNHQFRHGTFNYGERRPNARLTNEAVREIRSIYQFRSKTNGLRQLAERFGVNQATISKVVRGAAWKRA